MKIAFFILSSFTNLGGAQIFTLRLMCELVRKGHKVVLYMDAREWRNNREHLYHAPFEIKPILFRTNFLSRKLPFLIGGFLRFEQWRRKYDLWQVIGAYPAGCVTIWLTKDVPVFLRAHGDDVQIAPEIEYGICLDQKIKEKVKKILVKTKGLVALTKDIQHSFCYFGISNKKIRIIPNAIDISLFHDNDICIKKDPREVGRDKGTFRILTVGRNHFKKGYDLVPRIAKGLHERGLVFHWTIVTDHSKQIEKELVDIGLRNLFSFVLANDHVEEYIDFNGKVILPNSTIINEYKKATIFVLPTRVEGFGMVFIEALAAGLPIVATKARGVVDVLHHEKTGLLAEVDNVEQMVDYIYDLYSNQELRDRLISNGQEDVKNYDVEKIANRYIEFYEECTN
ncbi:glycosyltransferase family 4 protein [Candidatus Omnitrophota bacterium]